MKTKTAIARTTWSSICIQRASACASGLVLLALLSPTTTAQAQFNYTTNNGTITITAYTGSGGAVTIPDSTNGLPVTRIGDYAFLDCTSLTSVTMPNSVTSIGKYAFNNCNSLTRVSIPDSVRTIGLGAFISCINLTNVTLPNSLTYLGPSAFDNCVSLPSVTIPNGVSSIEGATFKSCTALTSLTIPNSVTKIGASAFADCASLTSIIIPEGVTTIEAGTFFSCSSLTNVTIPASVMDIRYTAFYYCTALTSICFRGNVPNLGASAFAGDNKATVYYLPGTTNWGSTFAGRPTAIWHLPFPVILTVPPDFGVEPGVFGFRISWATNASVVVEARTNLASPGWTPIATNSISMGIDSATDGWSYFSDPQSPNHPTRFYRLRSP